MTRAQRTSINMSLVLLVGLLVVVTILQLDRSGAQVPAPPPAQLSLAESFAEI
jgi:hypothetical protein